MSILLKLLSALFSYLAGRKAGGEAQRAADIEATNEVAQHIAVAESRAPADRAALADRLRDPGATI
jgi:hypothetical protein